MRGPPGCAPSSGGDPLEIGYGIPIPYPLVLGSIIGGPYSRDNSSQSKVQSDLPVFRNLVISNRSEPCLLDVDVRIVYFPSRPTLAFAHL